MSKNRISRRIFLMGGAAMAMGGCATKPRISLKKLGYESPNEKLNVAGIGVGGKGSSDIDGCNSENIVALCDVDWNRAGDTFARYPAAKRYRDYRLMLERETNIDAVTISTADHMHAFAAMDAMKRGIHVYVQKPMTHSVYEARELMKAARKYDVATQMGNQGHSSDNVRIFAEMIWAGVIGQVHEVHCWTNRPIWPQGIPEPLPAKPEPDHMSWDLWLGPAPWRPYNPNYAPFKWRGWFDFGTGALGDMGCHILDTSNFALTLDYPISVECITQEGKNDQTYPESSIIRYDFPARPGMVPVTIYWYDGGNKPKVPEAFADQIELGSGGCLFIGEKGIIVSGQYASDMKVYPESLTIDPEPLIPRSTGHYRDWIQACKGGMPACSNFDYAAPFTEWVLLGTIAVRCEGKLLWDGPNMRFTNNREANQYVKREYRKGWKL